MVQYVQNADIFGRVGSGIGQGLAEQLPKEIERNRLAAGLQSFEQEHGDLNPMQQMARLSAIPGVTPQMIQTFGELAKLNNQRSAMQRRAESYQGQPGGQSTMAASPDLAPVKQAELIDQASRGQQQFPPGLKMSMQGQPINAPQQPDVVPKEQRAPDRALPAVAWSPRQLAESRRKYIDMGFSPEEASHATAEDQRASRETPESYKAVNDAIRARSESARADFDRHLGQKLQKTPEGVYKDITGEMKSKIERQMDKELTRMKDPTPHEIDALADKYSTIALDFAKSKNELQTLAGTTGPLEILKPGTEIYDKLNAYSKIYHDAGQSEELYKTLQISPKGVDSEGNPVGQKGFGASPQASAYISYKPTQGARKVIDSYETQKLRSYPKLIESRSIEARRMASDLTKNIGSNDSFLAAAFELSKKDTNFDQEAFFDQLREDMDNDEIPLTGRQKREIAIGKPGIVPYWGDFLIIPWLGRKK